MLPRASTSPTPTRTTTTTTRTTPATEPSVLLAARAREEARLAAPLPGRAAYNLSFRDPDSERDWDQDSDLDEDHGEREDEWTYERLLALDEEEENDGDERACQRSVGGLSHSLLHSWLHNTTTVATTRTSPLATASRGHCAICLDNLIDAEAGSQQQQQEQQQQHQSPHPQLLVPPCGHGFHARCALRWFTRRHACPICRRDYREGG